MSTVSEFIKWKQRQNFLSHPSRELSRKSWPQLHRWLASVRALGKPDISPSFLLSSFSLSLQGLFSWFPPFLIPTLLSTCLCQVYALSSSLCFLGHSPEKWGLGVIKAPGSNSKVAAPVLASGGFLDGEAWLSSPSGCPGNPDTHLFRHKPEQADQGPFPVLHWLLTAADFCPCHTLCLSLQP